MIGHNENIDYKEKNNYDELFDSDDDKIFIEDPEETEGTEIELDIESSKNTETNIFCKQDEKSKKKKKLKLPKNLNLKMKLPEIQKIAEDFSIDLTNGETKNGKKKYKTKQELIDELTEKFN